MLNRLRDWFCPDLGIDLGTVNTLITVRGEGVVVDEPTVVALEKKSRQILGRGAAVGKLAKQMIGRTPGSIEAVKPVRHGVITDFQLCEQMLRYFFRKAAVQKAGLRPRVVIAVPSGISPVEKRAVFNSAERAGAGRIYLIEKAKAASIGAGLPISEPLASMICDIGGGTTEAAILSLGEIVASRSSRIAGEAMDEAIVDAVRQRFSLRIGMATAEQLKIEIGSAYPLDNELTTEVRGLDSISGIPRKAMITSEELRLAVEDCLWKIVNNIKATIEVCDPELIGDLADTGIILTGGGALLRNSDLFFSEHLGVPVRVDPQPLTTVARGTAICLDHLQHWRRRFQTEGVGF
ncbi:rod shape-determining protein [Thalassoglobus polymorphus]|uniref:Cell shape-determining protein MreB n=1 Tax=Thalassoglobus polymorphus TaxID=2527994 RepID=A0A517QJS9_9PLAN|nr:rod shape-determining protein [Thalassoglobus polymorphus]QDT31891.1 Rod shape-determining protein MreB [Thalassoglobus polymorphus]